MLTRSVKIENFQHFAKFRRHFATIMQYFPTNFYKQPLMPIMGSWDKGMLPWGMITGVRAGVR